MTVLYVEKKPAFRSRAASVHREIRDILGIAGVTAVRLIQRYDVDDSTVPLSARARDTVFSDPVTDLVHDEIVLDAEETAFAWAYHAGQFDQRADSAAQALRLITGTGDVEVRCAQVVVLLGEVSASDLDRIVAYVVNPVDSEVVPVDPRARRGTNAAGRTPRAVEPPAGLIEALRDADARADIGRRLGLAMSAADLDVLCAHFFDVEGRAPTEVELAVIDTYWSDHCRHTTFLTELTAVVIEAAPGLERLRMDYARYGSLRRELGLTGPETLMDMATIAARVLRARGTLDDLEVSDEVNAASLRVVGPGGEPWLLMFKNETHNHPTEIEPFGGASTCLGGAIRDPLSGRAYVYQAMRVSGSGDPRTPVSETLPGKLPQRTITTEAARGFSSYGNQVGLATGFVDELYHPGYVAKRMEIGAVCGAVPESQVRREAPAVGDQILLVGGRTGRDGCGGATGSSKAHDGSSIEQAGAEVQKGNPPVERALQRLFRRADVAPLIKRSNDFGAGGVSVAVGELADGVDILLDAVPVKYRGLTATELAISESQERMAVVVDPSDAHLFIQRALEENLEATPIAAVTDSGRLRMYARGAVVADIARSFLETNGAPRTARALIRAPAPHTGRSRAAPALGPEGWLSRLREPDVAARRGLVETFDSTIGAGTVLLPFGGRYQGTPEEATVCELPAAAFSGERGAAPAGGPAGGPAAAPAAGPVSAMAYGFDPVLSQRSPYHGAYLAVVESVCRLLAVGASLSAVRLSLQEYFPRPGDDPERWGLPAAALLGALGAQLDLGVPAVGGKDSMSGTFEHLDVPPTLVSFAVSSFPARYATGAAFSEPGSAILLLETPTDADGLPDTAALTSHAARLSALRERGALRAAGTLRAGGLVAAVSRACLGNRIGADIDLGALGDPALARYGSFYVEVPAEEGDRLSSDARAGAARVINLGRTRGDSIRTSEWTLPLSAVAEALESPFEAVFPTRAAGTPAADSRGSSGTPAGRPPRPRARRSGALARPRVLVPVFPGTNCETDTARAFEAAGAEVEEIVFRNMGPEMTAESVERLAAALARSHILALAGGFSAGDEPDGSGKYIAAAFRAPRLADAVRELLDTRDGLILGICNGFQALVRLGLVPFGEIRARTPDDPVLATNAVGRHVAAMVRTRATSPLSPWLNAADPEIIYAVPVSHGEGRFVCGEELLRSLWGNGQVATQYVDYEGVAATEMPWNPNGSVDAVEAVSSPDGRVLGKMAHSERVRPGLYKNFPETGDMGIFESGVRYFA
ncbi:MAG: phosphoribosylformylglycinamidine synthase [Spirochaetota bacterium]